MGSGVGGCDQRSGSAPGSRDEPRWQELHRAYRNEGYDRQGVPKLPCGLAPDSALWGWFIKTLEACHYAYAKLVSSCPSNNLQWPGVEDGSKAELACSVEMLPAWPVL